MLQKASLEDVKKYCDFVYSIALNQTKSCYPTYTDGIKAKEDFIAAAEKGITRETSELLLFILDEAVEGWIQFDWIPQENYLQLSACNIHRGTRQALTELLCLLQERFIGYTLYFGFPGCNTEAVHFLKENGFQCIEEDWNHSFFFENYTLHEEDENIARINRENYEDFRAVYQTDENTYWNCDRILESLEEWIIYAYYQQGRPVGVICLQGEKEYYEIFGVDFAADACQPKIYRALLTASLNQCKRLGAKYLTYLCEAEAKQMMSEIGFRSVGQYVCYIKEL